MNTPPIVCHTAQEVIAVLGGPTKFARWWLGDIVNLDAKRAWRWESNNRFPRQLFLPMSRRLREEHGIDALPSVWGLQDFHQQAAE